MIRFIALITLSAAVAHSSWGEVPVTPGCLQNAEFEPLVMPNPEAKVTFRCPDATPLDLIRAVGRQTRIPIGVILGTHPTALLTVRHSYHLDRVSAIKALSEAIEGTEYSIKREGPVVILLATDLTSRQKKLLTLQYDDFPTKSQTMSSLAATLTMWMRAATVPSIGFAGSILGSLNDEQISVHTAHSATTEQIANQIASQGSHGLWIFRSDALALHGTPTDQIEIEPYQHYTNRPS
jgi:hypothetical protein